MAQPYHFNGFCIPDDMVEALELYVSDGALPGGFLQAVLRNDFVDACGRADYVNIHNLPAYAAWIYNEAPQNSWGSREKVEAWVTLMAALRDSAKAAAEAQAGDDVP